MAGRAILQRFNVPFFDKLFAVILLEVWIARLPVEVGNLVEIANVRGRIAMAFQTKRHGQRLFLANFVQVIDVAVTFHAADAAVDVNGMVEIDVIRDLMDLHPWNWFSG